MRSKLGIALGLSLAAAAGLWAAGQEKPAPPPARIATLDLRLCFEKDRSDRIREIDAELQKIADAMAPRLKDADPKERERLRADYLEFYGRKKHAVYLEVVRVAELVAKERGYSMVLRTDRLPVLNDPEAMSTQINTRALLWHDASGDITEEVLKRLNEAYAQEKRKKDKEKDF